jgi:hypothetical protein
MPESVKFKTGVGNSECCVVVRGTTIRGTAVVRIAIGTSVTTVTTTLGFGLSAFASVLFMCQNWWMGIHRVYRRRVQTYSGEIVNNLRKSN